MKFERGRLQLVLKNILLNSDQIQTGGVWNKDGTWLHVIHTSCCFSKPISLTFRVKDFISLCIKLYEALSDFSILGYFPSSVDKSRFLIARFHRYALSWFRASFAFCFPLIESVVYEALKRRKTSGVGCGCKAAFMSRDVKRFWNCNFNSFIKFGSTVQ